MMNRRQALKTAALATAVAAAAPRTFAQTTPVIAPKPGTPAASGPYTLPPLPYAYDALEPHIDARTMEIHHDKHHAAYVANLNKAVADYPEVGQQPIETLMRNLDAVPEKIRTTVRNNGGGHYNHSLFWQMMRKGGGEGPASDLNTAITSSFGNLAALQQQFTDAASKVFGSGWAWLTLDGKQLKIETSANQDTPWSAGKPVLLGLDVWEHAYYLKYQNRRADYIKAWWDVVNWDFVTERYKKLTA